MKALTVLGSTGTIGVNTLDVVARSFLDTEIFALTAHRNVEAMAEQCRSWHPKYAVMVDSDAAERLESALIKDGVETTVLAGEESLVAVAEHPDVSGVMAGIVGAAGLLPNLAAARAGKRVMLANKESLVMSGQLFMDAVEHSGAELLPIDSEHNAIFQCMPVDFSPGLDSLGVSRILLTASGGPFRETPVADLMHVTPEQACAHPNWVMGRKISVDSATMMNKGLEVIEACWLFCATPDQIQVVIHPQSIIHSMVEYIDGSVLAQMGNPDMRTPIAYAIGWPARAESGVERLDLFKVRELSFTEPDNQRFPCLALAQAAAASGGTAPAILNAANEVAVGAFLEEQIPYMAIAKVVEQTLEGITRQEASSLEAVLAADQLARSHAKEIVQKGVA
ncbi:MAG: 1-deoxy-D-xylulose-5-phosphate reductoisomerase [Pseudomonadota bacterium]